jgi:hypothetical protein
MGLLDDAIREHLDLKRRRGADPADIERAERDALGPVRRGPEGSDEVDPDRLVSDNEMLAYDHEDEQDWEEPAEYEPAGAPSASREPHESAAREEYEPEFAEELEEQWDPEDEPFDADAGTAQAAPEPYAAPESPSAGAERQHAPRPRDQDEEGDTAEFDAPLEQKPPGDKDEDVLEETPEFLQDTPDHDRLWFEQRPPKDFDFDG